MNTHTILNVKTDKNLKAEAKKVAEELGVPLSTVVNSFLKQFVRDREVTFSANELRPTQYLIDCIEEAEREYVAGKVRKYENTDDFLSALNK
jgi:DNA-damage-inducible protein J